MIRLAVQEDMPELIRMAKTFLDESGFAETYGTNDESIANILSSLVEAKSLLTDGEHGMIGFVVFQMYFNADHVTAQELFWWISKEKRGTRLGIELLKAAEKQAKLLGAKSMFMISLNDLEGEKISKIYKRMGYKKTEQAHSRSL